MKSIFLILTFLVMVMPGVVLAQETSECGEGTVFQDGVCVVIDERFIHDIPVWQTTAMINIFLGPILMGVAGIYYKFGKKENKKISIILLIVGIVWLIAAYSNLIPAVNFSGY